MRLYVSVARKIILFELLVFSNCMMGRSHKEKRSSYPLEKGLRYNGIYRIEECWGKVGIQGFKACRYLFVKCDNDRAPWTRWRWADASVPKKIMKCTNGISDFLKDPQTLVLEGSLTPMHKSLLVSTLKNFAGILSKTQHGHHDLVEEIAVNTVDLATNKSGCCVLQHCLEHVREGEQKRRLIAEILANDLILSGDSFGYVGNYFYFDMDLEYLTHS
ncbi:hypothetical protein EZV62_019719 [Acer yangbiense]|uniref:YDG domain-containing protein n=1 Tax=Acer yangbiense TaxID=1000413 RepID=A0A5C7HBI6_9ROSI|nr:hypothetical protein EZV62_019719 [Acer yangbiense]